MADRNMLFFKLKYFLTRIVQYGTYLFYYNPPVNTRPEGWLRYSNVIISVV